MQEAGQAFLAANAKKEGVVTTASGLQYKVLEAGTGPRPKATDTVNAHSEAEWMALLPAGPIMGGDPRFVIFGALTDHTAHHRGALTVYARLLGKVPPMPYMEM